MYFKYSLVISAEQSSNPDNQRPAEHWNIKRLSAYDFLCLFAVWHNKIYIVYSVAQLYPVAFEIPRYSSILHSEHQQSFIVRREQQTYSINNDKTSLSDENTLEFDISRRGVKQGLFGVFAKLYTKTDHNIKLQTILVLQSTANSWNR